MLSEVEALSFRMLLGAVKICVDLVRCSEILYANQVAMYQFRSTMGYLPPSA